LSGKEEKKGEKKDEEGFSINMEMQKRTHYQTGKKGKRKKK